VSSSLTDIATLLTSIGGGAVIGGVVKTAIDLFADRPTKRADVATKHNLYTSGLLEQMQTLEARLGKARKETDAARKAAETSRLSESDTCDALRLLLAMLEQPHPLILVRAETDEQMQRFNCVLDRARTRINGKPT
jgi:hypothetical protein